MVALAQNWRFYRPIFKYKIESYKQLQPEKLDEKNGVICLVSMFCSWVMVLKLSKKVQFLQFCDDLSKKLKSVKAMYIYVSESSQYTLSENDIAYRCLSHRSCDISD